MNKYATFSEAIREGSKSGPQIFNELFTLEQNGSCVMGAGMLALWKEDPEEDLHCAMYSNFPYMLDSEGDCPACSDTNVRLDMLVMHLNDTHKYTRENIADWLEKEEERLGYELVLEETPCPLNFTSEVTACQLKDTDIRV